MIKTRLIVLLVVTPLLALCSSLANLKPAQSNETSTSKVEFACGQSFDQANQEYLFTTFAWNSRHKKPIIIWKKQDFSGNGFDPQTRCEQVSPRFQEAYENQSLKYLTYGTINSQPVICTSRQVGGDCDTLLLTLLHQDDAPQALEQLTDIFLGYADAPLEQSSAGVVFEEQGRIYVEVDIEEFLNN